MSILEIHQGRILQLKLDWPATRNALGPEQGKELADAVRRGSQDYETGVIVLVSSGPAFCAGGDLQSLIPIARQGPEAVRSVIYTVFHGLFRAIEESEIPILAAVDGAAVGLGADLAMAADVTLVGACGWLSQGWMKMHTIPATGGTEYVRRRANRSGVWRFLAEDRVDGERCQELGLAVAAPEAISAALELAGKLASMPREQVAAVRKLSRIADLEEHWRVALDYQSKFISSQAFIDRGQAVLQSRSK
jgi:enoyl-CoA hydratase/carnithine racemase